MHVSVRVWVHVWWVDVFGPRDAAERRVGNGGARLLINTCNLSYDLVRSRGHTHVHVPPHLQPSLDHMTNARIPAQGLKPRRVQLKTINVGAF